MFGFTAMGKKRKIIAEESNDVNGALRRKKMKGDDDKSLKVVTDINVQGFAESRAVEIQALTDVVRNVGGNHLSFQKLPRHMRRRAMSHNIKRIPRRIRDVVKSELEKTKAPGKRPSRRYRRRPSNLLAEYERRKRRIGWLETHIWHAKRFKMVERWGYRLALHPNDKSIRACYRAVSRHCLIQDVSYESYIEISGSRSDILQGLSHLTSNKAGLTFAAKMTASGTRQGSLMLYSFDRYPYDAVGQVTYLWCLRSSDLEDQTNNSVLWLCCHPSFYNQALCEVKKCFGQSSDQQSDNTKLTTDDLKKDPVMKEKVQIVSLKNELVKFRLYGPASNQVLADTLKLADVRMTGVQTSLDQSSESSVAHGKPSTTDLSQDNLSDMQKAEDEQTMPWWKGFYKSQENLKCFEDQHSVWSRLIKCYSPAEAPPHCVLSLTVRDPRLILPPKRTKVSVINTGTVTSQLPSELFTAEVGRSPLWDADIRHNVKVTKLSEHALNAMRNKHLVPGTPLELGDKESRIPIVLIQRPGTSISSSASSTSLPSQSSGYASGWDILLPSGWAMAFWVALVYRGARVGGIREARSISLQAGQLCEPFDFPDSHAGTEAMKAESDDLKTKYDRRPPAKRPNYIKFGFPSPFTYEFQKLVQEWSEKCADKLEKFQESPSEVRELSKSTSSGFYILRDRKALQHLGSVVNDGKSFLQNKNKGSRKADAQNNAFDVLMSTAIFKQHSASLVPVRLTVLCRGVPVTFGHICLPSDEDLKQYAKDKTYGGPVEQKHKDPHEAERKEERKMRLKSRRNKKRGKGSSKKIGKEVKVGTAMRAEMENQTVVSKTSGDEIGAGNKKTSDVNENTMKPVESHLLGSSLLTHTSKPVIGFVHKGDFNLHTGVGSGLGFCATAALLQLLEQQQGKKSCIVLVRNPASFQYRFATVTIDY